MDATGSHNLNENFVEMGYPPPVHTPSLDAHSVLTSPLDSTRYRKSGAGAAPRRAAPRRAAPRRAPREVRAARSSRSHSTSCGRLPLGWTPPLCALVLGSSRRVDKQYRSRAVPAHVPIAEGMPPSTDHRCRTQKSRIPPSGVWPAPAPLGSFRDRPSAGTCRNIHADRRARLRRTVLPPVYALRSTRRSQGRGVGRPIAHHTWQLLGPTVPYPCSAVRSRRPAVSALASESHLRVPGGISGPAGHPARGTRA